MFLIIIILLYVIAIILALIMPGDIEVYSSFIAPLVLAGIGMGVNAGASLLKGKTGGVPKWLENYLRENIRADRTSSFTPDESAFTAQTQANIDEILAQLPASREAFNANLASRGIFSAGEAPKVEYQQVIAPIARAATQASVAGQVGYERLRLGGVMAAEQFRQNALSLAVGATKGQKTGIQNFLDIIAEGGSFATKFALLNKLGLLGDSSGGVTGELPNNG